jgi:hypothetical protein
MHPLSVRAETRSIEEEVRAPHSYSELCPSCEPYIRRLAQARRSSMPNTLLTAAHANEAQNKSMEMECSRCASRLHTRTVVTVDSCRGS